MTCARALCLQSRTRHRLLRETSDPSAVTHAPKIVRSVNFLPGPMSDGRDFRLLGGLVDFTSEGWHGGRTGLGPPSGASAYSMG